MVRRKLLYSGRVQGVGFRFTMCQTAASYRVTGHVKNLPDGRVEAVVEGEAEEVARFLRDVQAQMAHYIRDVEDESSPALGTYKAFVIEH